jgi:YidC/Oxa1 family membrane protein insertase
MPFFISFFLGIRGLANYPLESMMYGGIFWFPDLSVADPYYILPVFTAVTMLITMEVCISYLNMITQLLFSFFI